MATTDLVAAALVLVPAMGLAWSWLSRHEGRFDANSVLLCLLLGIGAGLAMRFLEVALFGFDFPRYFQPAGDFTTATLTYSLAYTAIGYGLLESFAQTAILGFKKFRTRPDSVYLGAALGLGFGATWALQAFAFLVRARTNGATDANSLLFDGVAWVLCMGIVLTHAAAGAWIGRGAGEGRLWNGALLATAWTIPVLAAYWGVLFSDFVAMVAIAGFLWGAFAFWQADQRVIQPSVPSEERDRLRKQRRREQRGA